METAEYTNDTESKEGEMSFLDHLEELRWRIIYSLLGVIVGTIICWVFIDFLVDKVLLIPAARTGLKLQNLRPFGQIFLYFEIAIIGGVVLSIPNLLYQLWKFISPALRESERKYISLIVTFSSLCFITGICFAYFVMLPLTFSFAANFGSKRIENNFAVDEYFSIIISIMLAAGVVFELPMVSFFLSKLGILKPSFMKKYRRHAIVVIMILAAFLTPGTDPVSQIVLAIPLFLLYEISIFVSKISQKKN
ncbi:MAG: twin-arginine translocase subunit TatC [Clostridiales bacterium]